MPQVDLESLVCRIGGEGKVSCETLAAPPPEAVRKELVVEDPDFPAESFLVPFGDELGWVDVNAVYERDDSTKGSTNPKSHQQQQHGHHKPPAAAGTSSQRFSGSLAPKAPIIGLPNKIQHHSGYLGHSARRPANGRIFPKKSLPGQKAATVAEPGSPKVSCFGKVRSDRERGWSRPVCQGASAAAPEEGSGGCWASLAAFFRCGGGGDRTTVELKESVSRSAAGGRALRAPPAEEEAKAAAPGLGGMKRFSSGRRAASWGGDMDAEGVAWSGPLDGEEGWARRSVGSLEEAERDSHR